MTSPDAADLDRLGFGDWSFEECEALFPELPQGAHGLQAHPVLPPPQPFHAPHLAWEGFSVSQTSEPAHYLSIDCAVSPPLRILPVGSNPFPREGVACIENRVRVSLGHTGTLILDFGASALLLRVDVQGPVQTGILKPPQGAFAPAPISVVHMPSFAPIQEWLDRSEDSWLVDQASRRIASGRPWEQLAAVSMIVRLAETDSKEQRQEILDAAFSGRVHPWLDIPRRWIHELPAGQRAAVESLAWAVFGLEEDELRALLIAPAPEDREWLENLRRAAYRREELEGVSTLLLEAGHVSTLPQALGEMDEWVEARLHPPLSVALGPDVLLERIGERDFAAWWGLCYGNESF